MSELRVGLVRVDEILFHPHNVRIDLGDLRSLTNSIKKYGIMQPVVVEKYGKQLRLRAGHRRVAAARLAGLSRVPAVIHAEALDEDEWLIQAVQENIERRGLEGVERQRAIKALRNLGCTTEGIAEAFDVSTATIHRWAAGRFDMQAPTAAAEPDEVASRRRGPQRNQAHARARKRLIEAHQDEFDRLLLEERQRGSVDEAVVERCMAGERMEAAESERLEVIRRWQADRRPLNELFRIQGWNVWRDMRNAGMPYADQEAAS